jgi:hypothetical protein
MLFGGAIGPSFPMDREVAPTCEVKETLFAPRCLH